MALNFLSRHKKKDRDSTSCFCLLFVFGVWSQSEKIPENPIQLFYKNVTAVYSYLRHSVEHKKWFPQRPFKDRGFLQFLIFHWIIITCWNSVVLLVPYRSGQDVKNQNTNALEVSTIRIPKPCPSQSDLNL